MVNLKDLYCGAFEDVPFVSIEDLKTGSIKETSYYSETPFICFTDIGRALVTATEKGRIGLERARVDIDKTEPMNVYIITIKAAGVELKATTGKYLKPTREQRPPRSENKGVFPWGYFVKLDISGKDAAVFQLLSEFLVALKREPWEGLMIEEFSKETGIWEDDLKDNWLSAITPVLVEYDKKVADANRIGIDTKEVVAYLQDARKALSDKKLSYLIHLINKMDFEDIDKQLKEQREMGHDISQRILALQNLIKEAKDLDLDTVTVEHYLKTAKKHMKDNKWDTAGEDITKAEDIVKALKRMSRPQIRLSLKFPDKFLVEEENILGLEIENVGNVPAVKLQGNIDGDIAVADMEFPKILHSDEKVEVPATIYSDLGGLKSITIHLEYFREYDEMKYEEERNLELFFVDKEIKLEARSYTNFQAGFIRIDLEIVNNYVADIQHVEVEMVIKDDKAELVSVDPRASIIEKRMQFGDIPRADTFYATVFLDALYYEELGVKFEINFTDPKGKKKFFIHPIEPIIPIGIKAVVGEVPSAKTLIEKLATTHNKYLGKMYNIPVNTTPKDCYEVLRKVAFSLPAAQVWEDDIEVVKVAKGRGGQGKEEMERKSESWYTVQDQDPGYSAGLHIRVTEGTESIEISVAANDMDYSYSLLQFIQLEFINELIAEKFLAKDAILHQMKNPWLRQRVRGRQTAFLKMAELEDVDLEKKVRKASKERDSKFAQLRDQELKAHKYKAWSGNKKKKK